MGLLNSGFDSDNASECFPELIRSHVELCTLHVKANMVSHYLCNESEVLGSTTRTDVDT